MQKNKNSDSFVNSIHRISNDWNKNMFLRQFSIDCPRKMLTNVLFTKLFIVKGLLFTNWVFYYVLYIFGLRIWLINIVYNFWLWKREFYLSIWKWQWISTHILFWVIDLGHLDESTVNVKIKLKKNKHHSHSQFW